MQIHIFLLNPYFTVPVNLQNPNVMARIYYTAKKIYGAPINTNYINPTIFNHIKNGTTSTKFEFSNPDVFRFVQIWRDNILYKQFYLPDSIILYDVADFNFPTEFYFVVNIDNELEVRHGLGGEKVMYQDFPQIHSAVTHPQIIEKTDRTFMALSKMIQGAPTPVPPKVPAPLPEAQRDGYRQLVQYCLPMHPKKESALQFISQLQDYKGDDIHLTTLNYVMGQLENENTQLFIRLDWKADVEDLEWKLSATLQDNFGIRLPFSLKDHSNEKTMVSTDGVWEMVEDLLLQYDLQFSFINTHSDEYILAVYHKAHENLVEKAIRLIGY